MGTQFLAPVEQANFLGLAGKFDTCYSTASRLVFRLTPHSIDKANPPTPFNIPVQQCQLSGNVASLYFSFYIYRYLGYSYNLIRTLIFQVWLQWVPIKKLCVIIRAIFGHKSYNFCWLRLTQKALTQSFPGV